jgi:hypothetical protein
MHRTSGSEAWVPHISLVFCEMWVYRKASGEVPRDSDLEGDGIDLCPQRLKPLHLEFFRRG